MWLFFKRCFTFEISKFVKKLFGFFQIKALTHFLINVFERYKTIHLKLFCQIMIAEF